MEGVALEDVLRLRVRPQPADDLAALIHRAECGGRLVGGLAVSAAAHSLPRSLVARFLTVLHEKRVTMGKWGPITRASLAHLGPGHPLVPWRQLLCAGKARGADRWLTDYETSLRHSGRTSPSDATADLHDGLASFLSSICDQLVRAVPAAAIGGAEDATELLLGRERIPCSPYVRRVRDELWLWDSSTKSTWHWLVYPLRPSDAEPGLADRPKEIPAAAHLAPAQHGADDALAPYLGDSPAAEDPPGGAELPVFVTHRHDPFEYAEHLAERWRGLARPVLTLPLDDDELPIERLEENLGGSARQIVTGWSKDPRLERPVVVFVGIPEAPAGVAQARIALADLVTVVLVTTRDQYYRRWSIAERRVARLVEIDDPSDGLPLAVEARLGEQLALESAWERAALDVFDLHDPEARTDLLRIAEGHGELLDSARYMHWWNDGLLVVQADGALRFGHAGWAALAAGILGHAQPKEHQAAWTAGRRLAARQASNDA